LALVIITTTAAAAVIIAFAAALASGEGIVALGVRVCVSAEPRLHAVSTTLFYLICFN